MNTLYFSEYTNGYQRIEPEDLNLHGDALPFIYEPIDHDTMTRRAVVKKASKFLVDFTTTLGNNLDVTDIPG